MSLKHKVFEMTKKYADDYDIVKADLDRHLNEVDKDHARQTAIEQKYDEIDGSIALWNEAIGEYAYGGHVIDDDSPYPPDKEFDLVKYRAAHGDRNMLKDFGERAAWWYARRLVDER